MRATETLRSEHRVIEAMLDVLEIMARDLANGSPIPAMELRDAVRFFRAFADGVHHGKEEALLFPRMESRGAHSERGPTACMRREHEDGRLRLDGMDLAIDRMETDPEHGKQAFVAHAQLYASMLRAHIQKEDHCLFSMADQILGEADQIYLETQFALVDATGHGLEMRRHWIRRARDLCDRHEIDWPEGAAVASARVVGA